MAADGNFHLQTREPWRWRRALLWMTLLHVTTTVMAAGPDLTVCDPNAKPTSSGPARPQLSNQWKVRVEANILNENYSTEVHEFFDGPNNRGAVNQWMAGVQVHAVYSYDTNEILSTIIDPVGGDQCTASQLSSDPNNFLFGVTQVGNTSHIYSTAGALRFGGGLTEVYLGKSDVRGIHSDSWQSCVYWPSLNATMTVEWHFSDKDNWDTAIGIQQIPLRCKVAGKRVAADGTTYSFSHLYEMTDFQFDLSADGQQFETPAGTVCQGRKVTRSLPDIPDTFSFSAEIYTSSKNTINYITENFDDLMMLVKYTLSEDRPDGSGTDVYTVVDDFGSGISYKMILPNMNCTVSPISNQGFDVVSGGGQMVTMRSGSEFFFSDNASYSYEGVRTFNGVDCDVWVAERQDWPPGFSLNTTWEWYFATGNWSVYNGYTETHMPVGLIMTATNPPLKFVYNIYHYDEAETYLWKFDIGPCFSGSHSQNVQILLNGTWQDYILNHQAIFQYETVLAIANTAQVSPIRISNLKTDYNGKYVLLSFQMLDKPPVSGDVVHPRTEKSLTDAITAFDLAVVNGTFQIGPIYPDFSPQGFLITTEFYSDAKWGFATLRPAHNMADDPDPYMAVDDLDTMLDVQISVQCSSLGFSAGAMAGMAFGMLALGFLAVMGTAMLLYYRLHAPFRPQRFEMQPTTSTA